ncbi:MAG: inositol monophosphatase family protein [Planctomycetota bacterium]|jgi:histidinol phosphatase-like enzyme (inositol monophosphatase family)
MQIQPQQIKQVILELLGTASQVALNYFRQPVNVEVKADDSPVTQADREIEQAIRNVLNKHFPNHAIYGEEQGRTGGIGGTWVIDPIDGTKSFLLGNPLFGCLLGFIEEGIVQAGGLAMPALNEIWFADRRGPTTVNDRICHASECQELSNASLLTSSPDFFNNDEFNQFESLSKQIRYRRYGGDCYTYAMLAGGWVDLVVESTLYPFDYLPLVPIIEQAGGVISDWRGDPLELSSGAQVIAAATPQLHEAALDVLNRAI